MKNLEREVIATNLLAKFAKEVVAEILPQLQQFIGKKIFLADDKKAKIFNLDLNKLKPKPLANGDLLVVQNCYFLAKYGRLDIKISLCMNGGSYDTKPSTAYTKYFEKQITLGECKDGQTLDGLDELESIIGANGLNNVIDLDVELLKIKELQELEAKVEVVKRTIKIGSEFYKNLEL